MKLFKASLFFLLGIVVFCLITALGTLNLIYFYIGLGIVLYAFFESVVNFLDFIGDILTNF
jgi:hypothetical protein